LLIFDGKFVITHPVSGKPLANQNYDIHMPDGSMLSGITDRLGNSFLISSKAVDGLKIVLKK
jgi:type VI secretion system secreted protein VgrG